MLTERRADELKRMSKDELIMLLLEMEDALRAAEQDIIARHARRLWNEHSSYDTETARKAAEENPPPVVLQIRAALDKAGVGEDKTG